MKIDQSESITPVLYPSRSLFDYDHDISGSHRQHKKSTKKAGRHVFVNLPPEPTLA